MSNQHTEGHLPFGKSAFFDDIKALDDRYGPLQGRADGTLVSNDNGYQDIAPDILARLPQEDVGLGIFIGSGGVLSMLPELPVEGVVIVDKNPFVGELNHLLVESIVESDTPEEVFEAIKLKYTLGQHAVLRDLHDLYGNADVDEALMPWFHNEARNYGDYHWSASDRFPQVRDALSSKLLVTVNADITNPGFAQALRNTLYSHNEVITYANFTNVHAWIGAAAMKFVQDLPFHEDVTILYSSHKGVKVGDWPKMTYATSPSEYLEDIQD